MPSRILREDILDSKRIGRLSDGACTLYYKLLSLVDDFGRYEADNELIRVNGYKWAQDRYSLGEIEDRLQEVAEAEALRFYLVDGTRYLELRDKRRKPLAKKSKYPDPPWILSDSEGFQDFPPDSIGIQEPSPNTNTNTNTNQEKGCGEKPRADEVPTKQLSPPAMRVIEFPTARDESSHQNPKESTPPVRESQSITFQNFVLEYSSRTRKPITPEDEEQASTIWAHMPLEVQCGAYWHVKVYAGEVTGSGLRFVKTLTGYLRSRMWDAVTYGPSPQQVKPQMGDRSYLSVDPATQFHALMAAKISQQKPS